MSSASRSSFLFAVFAILAFLALAVAAWTGFVEGVPRELAPYLAGVAALLAVGTAVALILSRRVSAGVMGWRASALRRGFDYTVRIGGPGLPGLMFRAGTNVEATEVVDALASPAPFMAGTVTGRYADDTSIPRMIGASFIALPLPRPVPNIVLLGTGIGVLRMAGVSVAGRQRLSLEGDFDSSFSLYCPEGYERDALYIFAPDLMQLLVETTSGCDVEFADDWMFVYSRPGRYRDGTALDNLVRTSELVRGKLQRQTGNYSDDRAPAAAAPRTVSPEEHAAGVGKVGERGRRIVTRTSPFQRLITIASTLLLVGALAWYLVTEVLPMLSR